MQLISNDDCWLKDKAGEADQNDDRLNDQSNGSACCPFFT